MLDMTGLAAVYLYRMILMHECLWKEDQTMKSLSTDHKTFRKTYQLVIYLVLVVVLAVGVIAIIMVMRRRR